MGAKTHQYVFVGAQATGRRADALYPEQITESALRDEIMESLNIFIITHNMANHDVYAVTALSGY